MLSIKKWNKKIRSFAEADPGENGFSSAKLLFYKLADC